MIFGLLEVKKVAIDPIHCHCKRCHQEWFTRENIAGQGHEEPTTCSKDNCKTYLWRKFPQISFKPNFNPFTSRTPGGKLVFEKKDGSICEECFRSWAAMVKIPENLVDKMLLTRQFTLVSSSSTK